MATQNISVGASWARLASVADVNATITCTGVAVVEYATTSSDSVAPTVIGHVLRYEAGVTRALLGSGAIWARVVSHEPTSVVMAVDVW